jgi:hypothetical protein
MPGDHFLFLEKIVVREMRGGGLWLFLSELTGGLASRLGK